MFNAVNVTARRKSAPSARMWLEIETPGRRAGSAEITGMRLGTRIVANTNVVQASAEGSGKVQPTAERQDCGRRGEGAAQIVDHLPATDSRKRVVGATRVRAIPGEAENPRQQLPIAASPALMTSGAHIVARRKFLDDLDVGREARARKRPLEEIMAQQGCVGRPPGERRLEVVDFVDAFARIGTLAEHVLIDVGNGRGIGIDAAGAREHALKQRAFATLGKRWRDPGLQHCVALRDDAELGVEPRLIERMGDLANQPPHRFARQPRIGVEGQHVFDVLRKPLNAGESLEARVRRAAQHAVQFVKLAALSFPTDPTLLAVAPNAPTMQKQEARAARRGAVSFVETIDSCLSGGQQRRIARTALVAGIGPIREQREMQAAFGARKVMNFETFHKLRNFFFVDQHRRHDDDRAQRFRHAVEQRQRRQRHCAHKQRDDAIDEGDGDVDRRHRAKPDEQAESDGADPQCRHDVCGADDQN